MSTKSFSSAIYRNGTTLQKTILVSDINKEIYESEFRGHLFCPNEKCNARLKFVTRKNGSVRLFQAVNIHEHTKSCPYYNVLMLYLLILFLSSMVTKTSERIQ